MCARPFQPAQVHATNEIAMHPLHVTKPLLKLPSIAWPFVQGDMKPWVARSLASNASALTSTREGHRLV
eukprot:1140840-Pelagomonas_calceolata.AAC.7